VSLFLLTACSPSTLGYFGQCFVHFLVSLVDLQSACVPFPAVFPLTFHSCVHLGYHYHHFFVSVAGIPHQGVKERDHPVNKMAMEYLELVK